ncbi:MAG TPA: uroporphyrinogen decarboxylase family protein [Anaerolineaceae bacterium]
METRFANFIRFYPGRLAMPIGVYAGLEITGATVRSAVSDANAQSEAVLALHDRFHTPVMLTAMDLSAEAETFGCAIRMSDEEIPTVVGRRATSLEEIQALPEPRPGDLRTAVHLDTARCLVSQGGRIPVLGGMIGPISLAGRIFGVSEMLELTITDPETALLLLEKVAHFLTAYAEAFREAGAWGVIMAEPAAGLLSPRAMGRFSSPFVRQVVDAVQTEEFAILLHNCGAKLVHLPYVLQSGAGILHFGAPMNITAALGQVDPGVILCGNLDPTAVFLQGTPGQVAQQTAELLAAAEGRANFVISSGCDLPPGTPVENLQAFYDSVNSE